MAITLWRHKRPFEGLTRWFDDMDNWFDNSSFTEPLEGLWSPAVDIEEKDGKYLVKADLPGLKKKDIHLELHDGYLTLTGERKSENEEKKENYHRIERTYGTFQRSFKVPEGITEKDIKAKYHDGVLELTVPAPKVEKPKAIDVKIE
ncbi:MAG: Hsp20/alpha crystallin family protein [Deltaproteobacteria bacterium]|nr:Hsp20/alpha crystallin family protein [Deltaproteobacteria bacterium]MCK5257637.1 Hsp20/alpha crystallin family protein [Deltaproteobacteria bacterium]